MVLHNFIVFEGIDGAGTSTQLKLLKDFTNDKPFLFTAEPTSCPTGKFLRQVLKGDFVLEESTAAFLFAADRNEHLYAKELIDENKNLVTGIVESCNKNKIVVSDRYIFSSMAYQSISCGEELPAFVNSPFPLPQLLFFFEIKAEESLKRITDRSVREIYEEVNFLKKTEDAYKKVIEKFENTPLGNGMKIVHIDATKPKEEIQKEIWENIKATIKCL